MEPSLWHAERVKAVVITRPGSPEVLELRELPEPICAPEQVRVRVRAAGLNRADLLQRRGLYPAPPGSPQEIPGLEFAGQIDRLGERVEDLQVGDRVMGILGGGGYAEAICVDAGLCAPIPAGLDWVQAGAVPEAFITAYDALFRQGGLRQGETLLVQAAASGVGTAAIQLGMTAGAKVIGLTRSPEKRRRLQSMGLRHAFDPADEGLVEQIRAAAGPTGVHLALDLVGASALPTELETLGPEGRIVVIGLLGGARAELDLSILLRKRLRICGSVMRDRPLQEKIELTRDWVRETLPLFDSGRVVPIIDRRFPLEAAAEAHSYMESNRSFGKIVLNVGPEN